jgi:hypothetical protein
MNHKMKSQAEIKAEKTGVDSEADVGFKAHLQGASLWDLVQMECLARSHLVVEVRGEGGTGYLYFDRGRVVHASTARNRGEAAALEILGWTHGSFQACNRSWPSAPTIDMTHEHLILQAAQRRDEDKASNLVAFPGRGLAPEVAQGIVEGLDEALGEALDEIEELEIEEEGEFDMRGHNIDDSATPPGGVSARGESAADFPVVLRLAPSGAVLKNKGGTEELAEVVAYAHRLVQLTGELLGLDEFTSVEFTFTEGRCLMFAENNGDIVALRPRPDANLQSLRERLGL